MKKLLLILLCLPMIGFGQQMTYVPDDNFEQALIDLGIDTDSILNDSVPTPWIQMLIILNVSNQNIANLTGVEDIIFLEELYCSDNQLTSLDVSNNIGLLELGCESNQILNLDISNNTALTYLNCTHNQLTTLDVKNGNNTNMTFYAYDNPNLTCINVDNSGWSTTNWTNSIDIQSYFSNNCPPSAIQENYKNKELLKIVDLLGRETKGTNQPLFYIYDNGTVEKKIIIE